MNSRIVRDLFFRKECVYMEFWEVFSIIGTISFAIQGGLIAMENKYDLFAVYLFGIITAFGGGALRHVLIGELNYNLWNQGLLFVIAVISITLIIIFPNFILRSKKLWVNILDAVGIISFAIQGSISALSLSLPVSAVVVAAMLTATGGGVFRDVLSQRKPVLLSENIYGLWIFLVGIIIGMRWVTSTLQLFIVFVVFTVLRLLSYFYDWKIPYRQY